MTVEDDFDERARVRWFGAPLSGAAKAEAEKLGINVERARQALWRLYSEPVGQKLLDGAHGRLVAPLILQSDEWYEGSVRMLLLGDDLAHCNEGRIDAELRRRLRSVQHFDGARLHIGIWAGLTRVGLVPENLVPPKIPAPHPDLRVNDDGTCVALELKSTRLPQVTRNLRYLEESAHDALFYEIMERPAANYSFTWNEALLLFAASENDQTFHARIQSLLPSMLSAVRSVKPGETSRIVIDEFAALAITPDEYPSTTMPTVPRRKLEDSLKAISVRVHEAAEQLAGEPSTALRVTVLLTPDSELLVSEGESLLRYLAEHPSGSESVDAIAILNRAPRQRTWTPIHGAVFATPWTKHAIGGPSRWMEGLAMWRM